MTTEQVIKNDKKYICKHCDFYTCKKTDFTRHINTPKHNNNIVTTDDNNTNEKKYICDICIKEYNDRAGLWRHKKKCTIKYITNINEMSDKELIMILLKQNSELITQNSELFKNLSKVVTADNVFEI